MERRRVITKSPTIDRHPPVAGFRAPPFLQWVSISPFFSVAQHRTKALRNEVNPVLNSMRRLARRERVAMEPTAVGASHHRQAFDAAIDDGIHCMATSSKFM